MLGGFWRLFAYTALAAVPVVLAAVLEPGTQNYAREVGKNCALMAFVILILQVVLAVRIKWIERAFGFDILIRFHKYMAVYAAGLLLAHPLLLAAGGGGWRLLISLDLPWYIWVGKAALAVLLVNVVASLYQKKFSLKFETWRAWHDVSGPLILILAFTHSWVVGHDLEHPVLKILWIIAIAAAAALFVYHVFLRPRHLRRHAYEVVEVREETPDVWTVRMRPPEGVPIFSYCPGQFHFVTFYRGRDLPVEEHHWTISSSPSDKEAVSSTIKALGDFTATIGKTKSGDKAAVHGPFGRFSYLLHPEEKDLVFLSGGIGITPLMSMLRHMRDTQDTRGVVLIYANTSEKEILFREELSDIESGGYPSLTVVHVLEEPGPAWRGESGLIDGDKIQRYCQGRLDLKVFYTCGPAPMIKAVVKNLKALQVPDRQIRTEIFSFLD